MLTLAILFCNFMFLQKAAFATDNEFGLTLVFKETNDSTVPDGQGKVGVFFHCDKETEAQRLAAVSTIRGVLFNFTFNQAYIKLVSITHPDFGAASIYVVAPSIENANRDGRAGYSYIDMSTPLTFSPDADGDFLIASLLFEGEYGTKSLVAPDGNRYNSFSILDEIFFYRDEIFGVELTIKGTPATDTGNGGNGNGGNSGGTPATKPGGGGTGTGSYTQPSNVPTLPNNLSKDAVIITTPIPTVFVDLEGYEWAEYDIYTLAREGIIQGVGNSRYEPELNIKRGDIIVMLQRALKIENDYPNNFPDVPEGSYYYHAIGMLKSLGIARGYDDGNFRPEQIVSRQELVSLINRAYKDLDVFPEEVNYDALGVFADIDDIHEYALDSLCAAVQKGIIIGRNDRIAPLEPATRAETASILNRVRYVILVREHPIPEPEASEE